MMRFRVCGRRLVEHKDPVTVEIEDALVSMIEALRVQARMARQAGGDIAVYEGNWGAWKKAEAALEKVRVEAALELRANAYHIDNRLEASDA